MSTLILIIWLQYIGTELIIYKLTHNSYEIILYSILLLLFLIYVKLFLLLLNFFEVTDLIGIILFLAIIGVKYVSV